MRSQVRAKPFQSFLKPLLPAFEAQTLMASSSSAISASVSPRLRASSKTFGSGTKPSGIRVPRETEGFEGSRVFFISEIGVVGVVIGGVGEKEGEGGERTVSPSFSVTGDACDAFLRATYRACRSAPPLRVGFAASSISAMAVTMTSLVTPASIRYFTAMEMGPLKPPSRALSRRADGNMKACLMSWRRTSYRPSACICIGPTQAP